jgi:peptide deformylase
MILDIKIWPDESLRKKAKEIIDFDAGLLKILNDMAETMYFNNGIGLAATQIGIEKRMFVIDVQQDKKNDLTFICNPEIISGSGTITTEEGCLSFPDRTIKINRFSSIDVSYMNEAGEKIQITYQGLKAICFQHELDHLNGITMIDYID